MPRARADLPVVYSCSGCSSAAQMTNYIAQRLDREGLAEMSCIAGVGGNVGHLVRMARSGRPILALDGCRLACARSCLRQRGIVPDAHAIFSDFGMRKRYRTDFDPAEAEGLLPRIRSMANELRDANRAQSAGGARR